MVAATRKSPSPAPPAHPVAASLVVGEVSAATAWVAAPLAAAEASVVDSAAGAEGLVVVIAADFSQAATDSKSVADADREAGSATRAAEDGSAATACPPEVRTDSRAKHHPMRQLDLADGEEVGLTAAATARSVVDTEDTRVVEAVGTETVVVEIAAVGTAAIAVGETVVVMVVTAAAIARSVVGMMAVVEVGLTEKARREIGTLIEVGAMTIAVEDLVARPEMTDTAAATTTENARTMMVGMAAAEIVIGGGISCW